MPLTAHTAAADFAYKLSCRPNEPEQGYRETNLSDRFALTMAGDSNAEAKTSSHRLPVDGS